MTDSFEKYITYYLQRAREYDKEEFVSKFPKPVLVLVDSAEEKIEPFGTVGHRDSEEVPKIIQDSLLCDSSVVFHVDKRKGANSFFSMVTIGRTDNCDILIADGRVSACHAILRAKQKAQVAQSGSDGPTDGAPVKFSVTDGGSTNGTFINGRQLKTGELHELQTGDQISLGPRVNMIFFQADDFYTMLCESLKSKVSD